MDYQVLKPFKTVNRRLAPGVGPGSELNSTEDVSPHTFEGLLARDFIKAKAGSPDPVQPTEAPATPGPKVAVTRTTRSATGE